jgi:hypothetical protein
MIAMLHYFAGGQARRMIIELHGLREKEFLKKRFE